MQAIELSHEPEVDVMVVGAGPTGLTLACDLARRGVKVRIVDKASVPFVGSRGKGLQPRTLEVFEDLGVIDSLLAHGSTYPRLRVHYGWFSLPWDMMERSQASTRVPYPNAWLVPQSKTEAILRARLSQLGVEVEFGSQLLGFQQDAHVVTITLGRGEGRERTRARYLVGADGGHSFVRKQLGIALSGASLAEPSALVGDVQVDGLDRRYWHVWPRARGGAVALCPLPSGAGFQLFAQLSADKPAPVLDARSVRDYVATAIGQPTLQLRDPSWLSLYHPQARMVSRYRQDRVLLAGDAAHVHPPTGGQGLNIGVQDAYNLGWKLAAVLAGAPPALLESYQEERLPIAQGVLGLSTSLYKRGAKGQRRGQATKQLTMHYRFSTLSHEHRVDTQLQASGGARRKGQLQAGDRAPDAICADALGKQTRLFELFRGTHLTVLAFGAASAHIAATLAHVPNLHLYQVADQEALPGAAPFVRDMRRDVARSYDAAPGAVFVVRPDGYLGFCAIDPRPEQLVSYLAAIWPNVPA